MEDDPENIAQHSDNVLGLLPTATAKANEKSELPEIVLTLKHGSAMRDADIKQYPIETKKYLPFWCSVYPFFSCSRTVLPARLMFAVMLIMKVMAVSMIITFSPMTVYTSEASVSAV